MNQLLDQDNRLQSPMMSKRFARVVAFVRPIDDSSSALEDRWALFEKTGDAFFVIFGLKEHA